MKQINNKLIQIVDLEDNWKEAIKVAFKPLVENNYCQEAYVAKAIENVETLGDYIVLFPGVAFPHAAPEAGGLKSGHSITVFKRPITFPTKGKVSHFVPFVATANNGHIAILQDFAKTFANQEKQTAFKKATSKEALIEFWNGENHA